MTRWNVVFDTARGERVFRTIAARIRSRLLPAAGWVAEIAGVALIACAVGMVWLPGALLIVGVYVCIAANTNET